MSVLFLKNGFKENLGHDGFILGYGHKLGLSCLFFCLNYVERRLK